MGVVEGTGVGVEIASGKPKAKDKNDGSNNSSNKPRANNSGTSSTAGASGSSGSSSGSGSGSASEARVKQYLQLYRQMLDDKSARPGGNLLKRAAKGNWSTSYFQLMVRKTDNGWLNKSPEAIARKQDFKSSWSSLMGTSKMNQKMQELYARSKFDTKTFWTNAIKTNKKVAKEFKYWNVFNKGQAESGNTVANDPFAYKKYQAAFQDAYKQLGVDVPTGYEKLYFKSGQTGDQFVENLTALVQNQGAYQWGTGQAVDDKTLLFNKKGSADIRSRLQSATKRQTSYFGATNAGFGTSKSDSGLIKQSI